MYIDSHAHLTSDQVLPMLDSVLARAEQEGVERIVNICTDEKSLAEGVKLHERCPWVFNAAATTPHDVEAEGESFFPLVERAAREKKLAAIGETGLDYFYEHSNKTTQRDFLMRYFALAKSVGLPLIFHCRDAFPDLFDLSDGHYKGLPAVLHCFTGSLEEAKGVVDRGWYLSLSGIVTFKKSEALREVAKWVPLERLLIETDTPYLSPQSRRGQQNEPAFIAETAQVIAAVKGISLKELAEATARNAMQFFSLSKLP